MRRCVCVCERERLFCPFCMWWATGGYISVMCVCVWFVCVYWHCFGFCVVVCVCVCVCIYVCAFAIAMRCVVCTCVCVCVCVCVCKLVTDVLSGPCVLVIR